MEATITTLGDVFKTKVTESLHFPTIFVDRDGNEYQDFKYEDIDCYMNGIDPSEIEKQTLKDTDTGNKRLVVNGEIKQVGSHVKRCGWISAYFNVTKYRYDIKNIFKVATNLQELKYTFSNAIYDIVEDKTGFGDGSLPEDLFWNCPNLEVVSNVFSNTYTLTSIPSNIFAKNPKLRVVTECFSNCYELVNVPGDLFKNNPMLQKADGCFQMCSKIDKNKIRGIFKQYNDDLQVDYVFYGCGLDLDDKSKINDIRSAYFPDAMSDDQIEMACPI